MMLRLRGNRELQTIDSSFDNSNLAWSEKRIYIL
jgi:hypothetical protein